MNREEGHWRFVDLDSLGEGVQSGRLVLRRASVHGYVGERIVGEVDRGEGRVVRDRNREHAGRLGFDPEPREVELLDEVVVFEHTCGETERRGEHAQASG